MKKVYLIILILSLFFIVSCSVPENPKIIIIETNNTSNSSLSGISENEDNKSLFEYDNLQSSNFNPIFHF